MGPTALSDAFKKQLDKEQQVGRLSAQDAACMPCSKSHFDRLLKGGVPTPSKVFLRHFLATTSRAGGLSAQEYSARFATACALLAAVYESGADAEREQMHLVRRLEPSPPAELADPVAVLRLEVELERARHAETRLNYALQNAQFLVRTLWNIINALRVIIIEHDTERAHALHEGADPRQVAKLHNETRLALAHKHTAQREADRATLRIRELEKLWEQARTDVQRLALHPHAAHLAQDGAGGQQPAPSALPVDLLSQPALDDIADALAKARAVNTTEENVAHELKRFLSPTEAFSEDDEFAILLAATRMPDAEVRATALKTLVVRRPEHPEVTQALLRMAEDDDSKVQNLAIRALSDTYPGNPDVRALFLGMLPHRCERINEAVAGALAVHWAGDPGVMEAITALADSEHIAAQIAAIKAFASGWPGDPVCRDAIIRLLHTHSISHMNITAIKALGEKWSHDAVAGSALCCLARTSSRGMEMDSIVEMAIVDAFETGWPELPEVRSTLIAFADRGRTSAVGTAAMYVLTQRWPDDPEICRMQKVFTKGFGW
ncbi:HEAT repeat domain-containing protein [Streptomyces sp. NPDC092952]|uniref:HEAT repeat domain-containing protein n=1 Tax=Streptomyces sp. NPDC092952 TaxID=3366018 RepID=UPI003827F3A4